GRGELVAALCRVAELDPDRDGAGAERELGALHAALPAYAGGDLEEARRYLLAAVERAPEDARNHLVLARAVAVKAQDRSLFREHLEIAATSGAPLGAPRSPDPSSAIRELVTLPVISSVSAVIGRARASASSTIPPTARTPRPQSS